MTTPTAASLLHLVDRAERGSLLAEEAQQLRNGIRALGIRGQEAEQLRADLAHVQQAACRTAEILRNAEGRVAELEKHANEMSSMRNAANERAEQAEAAIERVRKLAACWEQMPRGRYVYIHEAARSLRDALDQPQQLTTTDSQTCGAHVPDPSSETPLRTCDLASRHAGWHHDTQHQDQWLPNSPVAEQPPTA